MSITPAQCRAARGLLHWSQTKLSQDSGVGLTTIRLFETERQKAYQQTREKLRSSFEQNGLEFIEENGGGPGVRLKR